MGVSFPPLLLIVTVAAGPEREYLSLPGNDCTAPAQDGCSWQAGRVYPGAKLWEHSVEKF